MPSMERAATWDPRRLVRLLVYSCWAGKLVHWLVDWLMDGLPAPLSVPQRPSQAAEEPRFGAWNEVGTVWNSLFFVVRWTLKGKELISSRCKLSMNGTPPVVAT